MHYNMNLGVCRACGATIVWIKTPAGKSMPCNSEPVYYIKRDYGKKVVTPNGKVITAELVVGPDLADGIAYLPHWSSCKNPDAFRSRNKRR